MGGTFVPPCQDWLIKIQIIKNVGNSWEGRQFWIIKVPIFKILNPDNVGVKIYFLDFYLSRKGRYIMVPNNRLKSA